MTPDTFNDFLKDHPAPSKEILGHPLVLNLLPGSAVMGLLCFKWVINEKGGGESTLLMQDIFVEWMGQCWNPTGLVSRNSLETNLELQMDAAYPEYKLETGLQKNIGFEVSKLEIKDSKIPKVTEAEKNWLESFVSLAEKAQFEQSLATAPLQTKPLRI